MRPLNPMRVAGFAAACGLALAAAGNAYADSVSDFYSKTNAKMIVPFSPGGGYDAYARTLARHMPGHIPGHPQMIVQNMPGAAGIIAANWLYNVAPQDGSIIAEFERGIPTTQIMGYKGPKYDPMKFHWLGSVTSEAGVLAIRKDSEAKNLSDVFKKQVILGITGPGDTEYYPALMDNTLGAKFKLIGGYPGSTEIALAIKRGEVQGISESWSSFKIHMGPSFLKQHINVLVQLSLTPVPEMTKLGAPMIMSILDKQHVLPQYTVEEVRTWWKLMLTPKAMGRPFGVGPGVSASKVKALRTAFMDTMKDPAFLKDAKKQHRDVDPVSGEQVEKMIADIASSPKSVTEKVGNLIKYHGPLKMVKIKLVKNTGKVTATKKGGRRIVISYKGKNVTAKVSGSRTKVTLNGKKAKRSAVKVGMTCTFTYPGAGSEAKRVACKE